MDIKLSNIDKIEKKNIETVAVENKVCQSTPIRTLSYNEEDEKKPINYKRKSRHLFNGRHKMAKKKYNHNENGNSSIDKSSVEDSPMEVFTQIENNDTSMWENDDINMLQEISTSDMNKNISIGGASILEKTSWKIDDGFFSDLNVTEIVTPNEDCSNKTFYGLPMSVKDLLNAERNIANLYDWQHECLTLPAVLKHENIVYSLPTSGGKTLVAEILMIKEMLVRKRNVILVLPYVSIVQEKVRTLSPFAVDLGFHIEEYAGSRGSFPPKKRRKRNSLFVATIEKANGIVNSFIENDRMDELGMVVVDEVHMIGDGGYRGALLEILLAKLLFKQTHIQIIGMSATIGNIEELQKFLKAEFYANDFRPITLQELVKIDDVLYKVHPDAKCEDEILEKFQRINHSNPSLETNDPDHIVSLVLEVIPKFSCLIFCATKKHCENLALMLSKLLPESLLNFKKDEKKDLLKTIHDSSNGVCKILSKSLPFGVAYHHSGLTMDERKFIEESYSAGILCLLCCTSTLAAGVNLPAKRVILRSPYIGRDLMTRNRYKQMIGRAGRAGIDDSGESVLIVSNKSNISQILPIIKGPPSCCKSSLLCFDGKGLRSLILALLGLKICNSEIDLMDFFTITLYYIQNGETISTLANVVKKEISQLKTYELIVEEYTENSSSPTLNTTILGRAIYKSNIDLDKSSFIHRELNRALSNLVLCNEIHLLYLVTPLDHIGDININWMLYYEQVSKMSKLNIHAAETIGVKEMYLIKKASGRSCAKIHFDEYIYKRFYVCLILFEVMNGKTIWQTAAKYNISRGFIQGLVSSTISFTSSLTRFTEEIPAFWSLKILFEALQKRLLYASEIELEEIMELPAVKKARARQLCKKGYRTIKSLAQATAKQLCSEIEHLSKSQAYLIISSAKMLIQEKLETLREEADEIDLNLQN